MEPLLISTRRCDEMDEDVKTLQSCTAEVQRLSAALEEAEAALEGMRQRDQRTQPELTELRNFQSTWNVRQLELELELRNAQENCAQSDSDVVRLRNELNTIESEVAILSGDREKAVEKADTLEKDVDYFRNETESLRQKYDAAVAASRDTKVALECAEEQRAEAVARLELMEREGNETELLLCDLRAENAELSAKVQELEAELDAACGERLEATEREERRRGETELLREELGAVIQATRQQLAERDALLVQMVERAEAQREVDSVRAALSQQIADLRREMETRQSEHEDLVRAAEGCIAALGACCSALCNITSHRDLHCHGSSAFLGSGRGPGSRGNAVSDRLNSGAVELQRSVEILTDVAEPICRAIADVCMYMLRGRRKRFVNSSSNVGDISSSNYDTHDTSFDRRELDDSALTGSVSTPDTRMAADEIINLPLDKSSALSVTWPLFSGQSYSGEEKHPDGPLSLGSIGLSLLAQSLVEALDWRLKIDSCMQEDRAKAKEMLVEKNKHIQTKLKLKVAELEETLMLEREEAKRKYETKSSECASVSEEATRLLKDNRRLKDKDAQLFAELKTMQEDLRGCKLLLAQTTANFQKTELQLAREHKIRMELELLLRRGDLGGCLLSSSDIERRGNASGVSPLNSECEASGDSLFEEESAEADLRNQVAALVQIEQNRESPHSGSRPLGRNTLLAQLEHSPRVEDGSDEGVAVEKVCSHRGSTLRERLKSVR